MRSCSVRGCGLSPSTFLVSVASPLSSRLAGKEGPENLESSNSQGKMNEK